MKRALTAIVFALCVSTATAIAGTKDVDQQINWEDLIPVLPPLENPFDALEPEQQEDLLYILRTKLDLDLGLIDTASQEYRTADEMRKRLTNGGLDVETFEKKLSVFDKALAERGQIVNNDLNDRVVRIPGYALPLEASEAGVKEFLLVPYVGACIHTPPPPPNQMVFVKLDEAYKLQGLYDPIWITGRMTVEHSEKELSFIDGASIVATGYSLSGISIEPYE